MGSITLYRGAYGENARQYQTCFYDLDNAAIDTDYTIETASATFPPTGGTVKAVRLNITQAGMMHFAGVQTDPDSPANLCPRWKMVYDDNAHTLTPDISVHAVPIGEKPSDWENTYFWKYYTKSAQTIFGGDSVIFYRGIDSFSPGFDPTIQYYYTDQITQPFYTLAQGFFACACWNLDGNVINSLICHTATAHGINDTSDGVFSAPGYFGTRLFPSSIGFAEKNTDIIAGTDNSSRNLMQLCEFEYNSEKYIGIATIAKSAEGFLTSATIIAASTVFWSGLPAPPYYGPTSSVQIGTGSYNDASQTVGITPIAPELTISDYGAGMHIVHLSDAGVIALFGDLWATTDFFSRWKNLRFDPMSAIMSLHKIPIPLVGQDQAYISIAMTKFNIPCKPAGARLRDWPLGSIAIPEFYGNRLDYPPHTTATIYLPFCGDYPLDITDIMGGGLDLTYRIDIATGDCIAFLVGTDRRGITTMSKTYKGNCAYRIPVSGSDGGGAGMLSALTSMIGGAVNIAAGNVAGGAMGLASGLIDAGTARVNSSVSTIQGNAAALTVMTPYVKIYRDVQARPDNYEILIADSAEAGGTVAQTADGYTVSGFTQFAQVELEIDATDDEKTEIERLLKLGVYV